MRTVSSYGVELRKQNIPIRQTLDIYRSAVSCLIEIYAQIWDELAVITEPKNRFNTAEHLVHTTKKNQARFDFDLRFPKMPSYLRRAAIQHALGSVSSYKTRMELWKKTDQKGGRPKVRCDPSSKSMESLYHWLERNSINKLQNLRQERHKENRNSCLLYTSAQAFRHGVALRRLKDHFLHRITS